MAALLLHQSKHVRPTEDVLISRNRDESHYLGIQDSASSNGQYTSVSAKHSAELA